MDHTEPAFVAIEQQFEEERAAIEEVSVTERIQQAFDVMIEAKKAKLAEIGAPPMRPEEMVLSVPDPSSVPMMKLVNPHP